MEIRVKVRVSLRVGGGRNEVYISTAQYWWVKIKIKDRIRVGLTRVENKLYIPQNLCGHDET